MMKQPSISDMNRRSLSRSFGLRSGGLWILTVFLIGGSGCRDDAEAIRQIQSKQLSEMQQKTQQDHLGEAFALLGQFVELNREKAGQQVSFHLNQWRQSQVSLPSALPQAMLRSWSSLIAPEKLEPVLLAPDYRPSDVKLLRNSFLFRRIVTWADAPQCDDPILKDWFESLSDETPLSEDDTARLVTAARLFDWTVRNVALQPSQFGAPPFDVPSYPLGLTFEGAGYRQTTYQTLWRGVGDSLQRSNVFCELCLQADIPAAILATQNDDGQRQPWCVGVLIGEQIFLFEPALGLPVPGPNQRGIATLQQARKDPAVMRRLNVAGYFDYPMSRSDIQQSVALLTIQPERLAPRMKRLEDGLTGDRRMVLFADAAKLASDFDDVAGIAGARLSELPVLAEVYQAENLRFATRDPQFAAMYMQQWAVMEGTDAGAKSLALARWRHLMGRFADDEVDGIQGARTLYLEQRAPEYEIDDLRIDVDLQKRYGLRRELGMADDVFENALARAQMFMRMGKRTATYWLSLVQYDDGRTETAKNWFEKRALDPTQQSIWDASAQYNLARVLEKLGDLESAIEVLKRDGTPAEHGSRLRARLIGKLAESSSKSLQD
ncbi:MAG: hypothetical protein AAGC97_00525 [Planctomycetota bacterium]